MAAIDRNGNPISPDAQRSSYSNVQPPSDWQEGDIDPQSAEGREATILKIRKLGALTIVRTNPHGFWKILELPSLGEFTQYEAAAKAAEANQSVEAADGA